MSVSARLRQHEFVDTHVHEVSQFEMKQMKPSNKYLSEDSLTDSSQLIKIRNTII